jgi:hypothetical protein
MAALRFKIHSLFTRNTAFTPYASPPEYEKIFPRLINIHPSVALKERFQQGHLAKTGFPREALTPVQGRTDRFESSLKTFSRNAMTIKLRGKPLPVLSYSIHANDG